LKAGDENINGILNKIVSHRHGLVWEKQGIYSDGATYLVEIAFKLTNPRTRKIGTIVYQSADGLVVNYHYKGLPKGKERGEIIDLLLEILHFEEIMNKP